jgi:hypothetical protein
MTHRTSSYVVWQGQARRHWRLVQQLELLCFFNSCFISTLQTIAPSLLWNCIIQHRHEHLRCASTALHATVVVAMHVRQDMPRENTQ